MKFLACRVMQKDKRAEHQMTEMSIDELTAGEVVIKVHYSSINFKDALAATGRGKIMRKLPLNAGIDLAGEVVESSDPKFSAGQMVLVNGCGMGESFDGGLAQYARVAAKFVMPLPDGLTAHEAMALGTAGFTAALALHRMEVNGQSPEMGPVVVTGASGGVGSVAVNILASKGYKAIALSGRPEFKEFLTSLGADKVCSVDELDLGEQPLEKGRFAGVIDNVGGDLLAKLLAHVDLWGNVASIGLAASHELNTTVFPYILRGVSILGASSANCPMPLREKLWQRLASDLKPTGLNEIVTLDVPLTKVSPVFADLLDRKHYGRIVVNCQE